MSIREQALELHEKHQGKIEVVSKVPLSSRADLALAYTPGVAEPCGEPQKLDTLELVLALFFVVFRV